MFSCSKQVIEKDSSIDKKTRDSLALANKTQDINDNNPPEPFPGAPYYVNVLLQTESLVDYDDSTDFTSSVNFNYAPPPTRVSINADIMKDENIQEIIAVNFVTAQVKIPVTYIRSKSGVYCYRTTNILDFQWQVVSGLPNTWVQLHLSYFLNDVYNYVDNTKTTKQKFYDEYKTIWYSGTVVPN